MPAALADPDELDAAIDAARKRLERAQTPDPRPVPHRKTERIEQAQQRLATEDAAQRGAKQAAAQAYLDRIAAGEKITGSPPAGAAVALAEQRLAEIRQAYEAKTAARAAAKAAGKPCRGRKSVPVEQYSRVRRQQAKLDAARAAEANRARADADRVDGRCANMTDPQSRLQPIRNNGWVQGYNCQAFTSADGIILATEAGTSPVDCEYFPSMVEKATAAAQLVTNLHNRGVSPGDGASRIGIMLADAGYCTLQNLTLPGPDRLIATGKSRDLQAAANDNPAAGIAPATAGPVEAMAHRLRTPDGIATYRKRSHIAETTFGHAKHNLGFRRFIGRGLARARSEWALHATIHNIGKILTRLAGNPLPAPA